jgi:hypothetical protein
MPEWSKGGDSRSSVIVTRRFEPCSKYSARLAQSVERWPFKPVVVGSSPTMGDKYNGYSYQTSDLLFNKRGAIPLRSFG